ncbi:MAG: hypothetical protein IKF07_04440 [Eubacterium sp.]|nr:hypothetical protein [Eubacterium sp.]
MGTRNKEHAHMPPSQRAKQFLPFDAVAGLREALKIQEHKMGLISRKELSDEVAEYINETLARMKAGDHVAVRYFRDEKGSDSGREIGDMVLITGTVTGIDSVSQVITVEADDAGNDLHGFNEQTRIPIGDITSLDISEEF